jgi:hypothetical protein
MLLGAAALMALGAGCASDEESPRGRYTEPCNAQVPDDCEEGLECILGQCTQGCAMSEECRANLRSDIAICQDGTCFESCTPSSGCDNGLRCTMALSTIGTCRP